jgi:hypothetical protein
MAATFNWFAAHMKAKMLTASSRSSSNPNSSDVGAHRPQFLLFAALTMLGLIIVAIGAFISSILALGDVIGLPNQTLLNKIESIAPVTPVDPDAIPSVAALLKTLLNQHTALALLAFTALIIFIAFLFRKIVLKGLRD